MATRPVMLVILDGFGWREDAADNAVRQAKTPNFTGLWKSGAHAFLHTSGRDVGLPDGQMGNSEVGHLNIGAGRVVKQELVRIGDAVEDGSIAEAPAFIATGGGAEEIRRDLPPDGTDVAGRRAFPSGPRRRRWRGMFTKPASGRWCTPSPTGATRRRNRPAKTSSASSPRCPPAFRSAPSSAATGSWTATSGGTACLGPTPLSWTADGRPLRHPGRRDRSCLRRGEIRRVRAALGHRRLCRDEGWRRRPVLQFPRRSGAGDFGCAAGPGVRRLPAPRAS